MSKVEPAGKDAVIGIDLGGTKLSGALLSEDGDIIHKTELFLEGRKGAEAGALVTKQLSDLEGFARENSHRILSVGICVPGISNPKAGTVWAPNIPGWKAYPLHREVKNVLSDSGIPLCIESDRNCAMMGEIWKGSAKGCKHALFLAVGTGIGMGMVSDGHLINGMNGIAGAIGWMTFDRLYRNDYGHCGQFEYHASGTGIVRNAEKLMKEGMESKYLTAGQISARDVFNAYAKNDRVAIRVIEQFTEYWGMAVANLVSIFNPEKIIFGGGVFGPAADLLDRIFEHAVKWAQPISIRQADLSVSSLKGDAGLIGAGYMALKISTFQNGQGKENQS